MFYWTIGQFPLYAKSGGVGRLLDVPPGVMVEPARIEVVKGEICWTGILFAGRSGFCDKAFLEVYEQVYPQNVVVIENQTASPHDAQQYYVLEGRTKYNACGELCICSIVGDSMGKLSEKARLKAPAWWKRIILGDSTTSLSDLEAILMSVYGYPALERLQKALSDRAGMRLTPGRLERVLRDNAVIVGVRISASDGYLARSGVAHWVVVREVAPNGIDGGLVKLYNPFTNAVEVYAWREFKASVGTPAGMLVPKLGPACFNQATI